MQNISSNAFMFCFFFLGGGAKISSMLNNFNCAEENGLQAYREMKPRIYRRNPFKRH